MERPFRAPLYPVFPAIALVLSIVFFAAFAASSWLVTGIFFGLLALGLLHFRFVIRPSLKDEPGYEPLPAVE